MKSGKDSKSRGRARRRESEAADRAQYHPHYYNRCTIVLLEEGKSVLYTTATYLKFLFFGKADLSIPKARHPPWGRERGRSMRTYITTSC